MLALSGVILSGGRSRRMGQDKAFLTLGGERLIDRVAHILGQVCDELIVVANDAARYASPLWRVVPDVFPDAGSLGGLYTGLEAAQHPYAIVVACDMPFLNVDLLRYLAQAAQGWDAVVPQNPSPSPSPRKGGEPVGEGTRDSSPGPSLRKGGGQTGGERPTAKAMDLQPLHAVYHRRAAAAIRARIAANDLRMISFLADIRVNYVGDDAVARFDPQGLSFFNANTPDEWQAVLERLNA